MMRACLLKLFRLYGGEPITLRPVILNGPPGIGKSVWARSLAAALSVPYGDVDASKGGGGMALVGVERGLNAHSVILMPGTMVMPWRST